MKWKLRGDRPIYAQLIEQLERAILTGEFPPGSAVPSVRTLAIEAEVNPNTMQKALAYLEAKGLLHTHRTAGRTVTEDRDMIDNLKEELAHEQINAFFEGMRSIGIGASEATTLLTSSKIEVSESEPEHNFGGNRIERSEIRHRGQSPLEERGGERSSETGSDAEPPIKSEATTINKSSDNIEASDSEPEYNSGGDRVERSETRQEGAAPPMKSAAMPTIVTKEVK